MTKDKLYSCYIRSPRLIHKEYLCLRGGIAKQLFPGRPITIQDLRNTASRLKYTPEKLYDVYRDSILMG